MILVSESPENFRNMKTKLVELDPDLTVLSSRQCKGLEFRHGVVVDLMLHDFDPDRISHSRYQLLSCLYVAVTRFRNSVTCLATIGSPLLPDHP